MIRTLLVSRLRSYFRPRREVLAAYLHGSRATGTARESSDLDVAVLLAGGRHPFALRLRYTSELSRILGFEVDVAILNEADPLLRFRVMSQGIEVLVRKRRPFEDLKHRWLLEYWDFLPVSRALEAPALRRLAAA